MTDANFPLEVTCRDVKAGLDAGGSFCFIDCREPDEYVIAKIEGATLMPMSQLAERVAELEPRKGEDIVIHCHHGGRSLRVAMWLRQQGFTRAASMAGGIDLWATEIDTSVPRY